MDAFAVFPEEHFRLPIFLRDTAFAEHIADTPRRVWAARSRRVEKLTRDYQRYVRRSFHASGLVDQERERAMFDDILRFDPKTSAFILVERKRRTVGSLGVTFSTDQEPIPRQLRELAAKGWIEPFAVEKPTLRTDGFDYHVAEYNGRIALKLVALPPHWTGAMAYIEHFGLDPNDPDDPLPLLLNVAALATKMVRISGATLPASFGAQAGAPISVRRIVLTCDAESPRHEAYYRKASFRRRGEPFSDPRREGKKTVVLETTVDAFLTSWVSAIQERYQARSGIPWLQLQFNEKWPLVRQSGMSCAERVLTLKRRRTTHLTDRGLPGD